MFLTAQMLDDRGACRSALVVFERLWPHGTPATNDVARVAEHWSLSLKWVADKLVTTRRARVQFDHVLATLTPTFSSTAALRVAVVDVLAVEAEELAGGRS